MLRKVDYAGRINIPNELCEKFAIKKDDVIQITDDGHYIKIKKYRPEFVCAITGKITDDGHKIGDAFISMDGIKEIIDFVENEKKET